MDVPLWTADNHFAQHLWAGERGASKSHHHIRSLLTPPRHTLKTETLQKCNQSCQYHPPPSAPHPANKSCSFAEMEGCDPGCLSHHILPPLSHCGERSDISNKMLMEEKNREIHICDWLTIFSIIIIIKKNILSDFRTDQQTSNVHRFNK